MTLTAREAELLGRVADDPDDDNARRVLGDYWIESGDVARGTMLHAMFEQRRDVVEAIVREHGQRWCAPLIAAGFRADDLVLERGFLPAPVFDGADARLGSPELLRLAPAHYQIGTRLGGDAYTAMHDAVRVTATGHSQAVVRVAVDHQVGGGDDVVRETDILRRVAGGNVIRLLDAGVTRTGPAFALPWAGSDLADLIDAQRACGGGDAVLALAIGLQLCRACLSVHAADVIHAAIRPDHVLLCSGDVVLGGFAHAVCKPGRWITRFTRASYRPLGFAYMSPEQVMGRQLTPTSDVFAIAVIVAELAAGQHPLREAETAFDMLQAVRDRAHVIATDTPLGATLHRIVFADQDGRPSAVELATMLEDLAERAGLDVTPAGLARRRVELGI